MATMACRDTGIECDYFVRAADSGALIENIVITHGIAAHNDEYERWKKSINEGRGRLSNIIGGLVTFIKDGDSRSATVACTDLGITCDWNTSAPSTAEVFKQLVSHLETQHPDDLKVRWKGKTWHLVKDLNAAIKRTEQ
jgi:predicted small metal-binding protein